MDEFKENEDLPNTTNPDDWARISGKKGERIVFIRTLITGKQGTEPGRSIDTVSQHRSVPLAPAVGTSVTRRPVSSSPTRGAAGGSDGVLDRRMTVVLASHVRPAWIESRRRRGGENWRLSRTPGRAGTAERNATGSTVTGNIQNEHGPSNC